MSSQFTSIPQQNMEIAIYPKHHEIKVTMGELNSVLE